MLIILMPKKYKNTGALQYFSTDQDYLFMAMSRRKKKREEREREFSTPQMHSR
jgi:hypothetical protein